MLISNEKKYLDVDFVVVEWLETETVFVEVVGIDVLIVNGAAGIIQTLRDPLPIGIVNPTWTVGNRHCTLYLYTTVCIQNLSSMLQLCPCTPSGVLSSVSGPIPLINLHKFSK